MLPKSWSKWRDATRSLYQMILKEVALPLGVDGKSYLLEECNPVILVLVLMLVLVGRPSAGARGSKKLVLLAFLLSIRLLQNYEHSIILE